MWMDDTEITNNEYRQFVAYVKDSFMRLEMEATIEIEDEHDDYEVLDYDADVIGRRFLQ